MENLEQSTEEIISVTNVRGEMKGILERLHSACNTIVSYISAHRIILYVILSLIIGKLLLEIVSRFISDRIEKKKTIEEKYDYCGNKIAYKPKRIHWKLKLIAIIAILLILFLL